MATMAEGHIHERRHVPDRRSELLHTKRPRLGALDWISMALLIVGGVNWGLVGLANVDVVAVLFGEMSALSRVVYVLVGMAALYTMYISRKLARS